MLDVYLDCIGPDELWQNEGRGKFRDSKLSLGADWIGNWPTENSKFQRYVPVCSAF